MSRIKPFYELKFPVSSVKRVELLSCLAPLLEADSHGQSGRYDIFSQYYDTPDKQFYQDKVNGEYSKTKIRLRYYRSDNKVGWHFPCLEIKQRRGNLVTKHRYGLNPDEAADVLSANPGFNLSETILARCKDPELRSFFAGKILIPAVAVYYKRSAFHVRGIEGLRLTFDLEIAGLMPGGLGRAGDAASAILAMRQHAPEIFEIKSYGRPPEAILNRLVDLGVVQQSFSKYAHAIQALHTQGLLRLP
ncbi:MAG: polyphosphate polymerase domain-containing protein [Candidatus Riflebacteria bacterium]|nr:polyphosphate polymerase domain-containing protein [Candidatus Riflebacteria bacterium]